MQIYKNIVAIPPGDTIKEELEFLNITIKEFSEKMNISEDIMIEIIEGKTSLSPEIATKLETNLGIPSYFWERLDIRYKKSLERINNKRKEDNLSVI